MAVVARQTVWNFFLDLFGGNEYAAAGACGNMQWESGLDTSNAENQWNNMTGYSDSWLTTRINNCITQTDPYITLQTFLQRSWYVNGIGFGYGLSQWTAASRRTELWNRTISQGIHIDDAGAQLQFVKDEFTGNATSGDWSGVRTTLMQTTNVHDATYIYCRQYEGGSWSSIREQYANSFYNEFAGHSTGYEIVITAQGNCRPFATLHLNETIEQQIFYADAGVDIFIHANVGAGDYFQLWVADYPQGLVIDVPTGANTFFTMPSSRVNITCQCTGETPEPAPYPPEPPTPILNPKFKKMPIWMYPCMRT